MHLFPFPISRRSGSRKSYGSHRRSSSRRSYGSHRRSGSRKSYGSHQLSGSHRNHISEYMRSESPPSEWQESPQFQCSETQRLMPKWTLKNCDHTDDSAFPGRRGKTIHNNLKSFIPKSFASFVRYDVDEGYHVDKVDRPFYPRPLSDYRKCKIMGERLNAQVDFVIQRINSQLEMLGERYELDKLVKVVEKSPCRTTLVTFTVKEVLHNPNVVRTVRAMVYNPTYFNFELNEWSFKPEEED